MAKVEQSENLNQHYDFDYIVVGSGFGGSVSAMRLAQKGYNVGIIEAGKRWHADEYPKSNWTLRKYLWLPSIGFYGIQRMYLLRNVMILSGAGVGGGSLNYANTLYIPSDVFFNRETVKRLGGKDEFVPYYKIAQKMLGVIINPVLTDQDNLIKETAAEIGKENTFCAAPVGVYFGKQSEAAYDPFFFGEGPDRIGCELCGECMTGCKKNAKNTLDKNYLYFAQKFGARIFPENQVIDVRPLSPNGDKGYVVKTKKTTACFGSLHGNTFTTKGIIFSAGALGTNNLLIKLKKKKSLPNLSEHLGKYTRTNSEAVIGVVSRSNKVDFSKGVAITSSIHPSDDTHIEPVRYGKGHDAMAIISGVMTDGSGYIPRIFKAIGLSIIHPIDFVRGLIPFGWAKRSIILLVMQTLDNYINLQRKRTFYWPFSKILTSTYGTDKKNPTWIPIANDFGRRLGKRINGIPMGVITENLINAPITAHIMGGCTIGQQVEEAVIDEENHVLGYKNMLVCDGSQIPENLGVNPALSITAFTERAMSFIQPKNGAIRNLIAEKEWGVTEVFKRESKHEKLK